MSEGYLEPKGAIVIFLQELYRILNDSKLDLRIEPREDKKTEFTTKYCLTTLGYQKADVIDELKKLKIENYVETCDDKRNKKSNRYYVFGKLLKNKQVYIKVKIQSFDQKIVLCMSFHFAEYEMTKFPYKD